MHRIIDSNIGTLAKICADDVSRHSLTGVLLTLNDNGYIATATDGRRLVELTANYPMGAEAFVMPPGVEANGEATDAPRAVVIPAARLRKLKSASATAKRRHKFAGCVAVSPGSRQTTLATSDEPGHVASDAVPNVDGRFPDVASVKPRSAARDVLYFNPKLLADTLRVVADLGVERVALEIRDHKTPLVMTGANDEGQGVYALVMQLTK